MGHPSPARVTVRPTTLAHQAKCRKERRRQSARSGVLVRPGLADGRESGRRQRRRLKVNESVTLVVAYRFPGCLPLSMDELVGRAGTRWILLPPLLIHN